MSVSPVVYRVGSDIVNRVTYRHSDPSRRLWYVDPTMPVNRERYERMIRDRRLVKAWGHEFAATLAEHGPMLSSETVRRLLRNETIYVPSCMDAEQICEIVNDHCHRSAEIQWCERCEELRFRDSFSDVDGDSVCGECCQDANSCTSCDALTFNGLIRTAYGTSICESCAEDGCVPDGHRYWYRHDDLYSCEHCDHYGPDECTCLDEEEEDNCPELDRYHGGTSVPLPCFDTIGIGFELEMEAKSTAIRTDLVRGLHTEFDHIRTERDGSLDDATGFETVTDFGSLDTILEHAKRIHKICQGRANGHDTKRCGLHVSISRVPASDDAGWMYRTMCERRLVYFWNAPANWPFLFQFTRRESNSYCAENTIRHCVLSDDFGLSLQAISCRGRVHFPDQNRIEIRAFKSTLRLETLLACIELTWRIWEFCRDESVPSSRLTFPDFLSWMVEKHPSSHVLAHCEHLGIPVPSVV